MVQVPEVPQGDAVGSLGYIHEFEMNIYQFT